MSERNAKNEYVEFYRKLNEQLSTVNCDLRDESNFDRFIVKDPKETYLQRFDRYAAVYDNMSDAICGESMYNQLTKYGRRIFVYDLQADMPREIRLNENNEPVLSEPLSRDTMAQKPKGLGFWKNVAHALSFGRAYKEEFQTYNAAKAEYKEELDILERFEKRMPSRQKEYEAEGRILANKEAARLEAMQRNLEGYEPEVKVEKSFEERQREEEARKEAIRKRDEANWERGEDGWLISKKDKGLRIREVTSREGISLDELGGSSARKTSDDLSKRTQRAAALEKDAPEKGGM